MGQNRQRLTEPHPEPCSHSGTVSERWAGPDLPSAAQYEISVKGLGSGSTLDSGSHLGGSGLQAPKLLQRENQIRCSLKVSAEFYNKMHADFILREKVSVGT